MEDGPTRGACSESCRRAQTRLTKIRERPSVGPDGRHRERMGCVKLLAVLEPLLGMTRMFIVQSATMVGTIQARTQWKLLGIVLNEE